MLERGGHIGSIAAMTGSAVICWPVAIIILLIYVFAILSEYRANKRKNNAAH